MHCTWVGSAHITEQKPVSLVGEGGEGGESSRMLVTYPRVLEGEGGDVVGCS